MHDNVVMRSGAGWSLAGARQGGPVVDRPPTANFSTAFNGMAAGMDCIPRTISRAQTFDALSSMANIAGYR